MKSLMLLLIAGSFFQPGQNKNADFSSLLPAKTDSIMGLFVGRTPCKEIMKELNIKHSPDCFKLKWTITFYHDPVTHKPTIYKINRTLSRTEIVQGKWFILTGTKEDPAAIVYQLVPDKPGVAFYFQKGDDNVLFFLTADKQLMPGNEKFSYTLNRRPLRSTDR